MDMANKRSLYLNDNWDITLDGNGDITTTSGLYCDAQNVANATRLFTKDAFLAQTKGIPHFNVDLGTVPALSEIRSWYRKASMDVENIQSASIDVTSIDAETRTLRGLITATADSGQTFTVEF
jgi:hypothetical protein